MMNIRNMATAVKAAIMNWEDQAAKATQKYVAKEFNGLLGFDEETQKPIYMYDGETSISRGIVIPQELAVERLSKKTQLEADLREAVLSECLPDVKEHMLELESTVNELYAQWNSEGNIGISPNFPEADELNELRNQIIEESEALKALRDKGWQESCMHVDTFDNFIERVGAPVERGKVREYLRFLTPIRLKTAIDEKNKNWKLTHNWEDNFSHEEFMEIKRLVWSDSRRNKDINYKREGSKFDVFYSQLMEGLRASTFSLYKKYEMFEYFTEFNVESLTTLTDLNRELVEKGVSAFEIIPRFYSLYDEEIIGQDQLKELIGFPEDFDKAFTWIKSSTEYRKDCIHTGEIRYFKSMFYDMSLWKVRDLTYNGETYSTAMGLVYSLMLKPGKESEKALFKQAKDYNGMALAQDKAKNNFAYAKGSSKAAALETVADILMEDEGFRTALMKSGPFKINLTKDPAWSKVLNNTRNKLFEEKEKTMKAVLAELRDTTRIEEEEHKNIVEKYNLSKDQIEEINGKLAENEFLGLIKKAEELVEEFYEEV